MSKFRRLKGEFWEPTPAADKMIRRLGLIRAIIELLGLLGLYMEFAFERAVTLEEGPTWVTF